MTPYELPQNPSVFVGRSAELDALRELALDGARLITLTGPSGIGKTRLAIEWASTLANEGARVAFLPAGHLQDARFVARMIATAGASDHWPDLPLKRLPVDLEMVMVLDGLDHVSGIARRLDQLLDRCPNVLVVATCRVPLNASSERVVRVGPLTDDGPRLFGLRAGTVAKTSESVEELCKQLGGNPLAIELVAQHDIAGAPESVPDFERDLTLPEIVDWSIGQLPPHCQALLRRIAVLSGSFFEPTLRAAAGFQPLIAYDADRDRAMLVKSGLVRGSPEFGYSVPVAVREVALAQLNDRGAVAEVRLEFARHLLHRATEMRTLLTGPDRERALRWFELEEPSLNLALGIFIERHRIYLARKLISALWPYWVVRGRMRNGRGWLDFVISRTADQDPDDVERELLFASGLIELLLGNVSAARVRLAGASRPGCPHAQEHWQRAAVGALGVARVRMGEPEAAIGLCELYLHTASKKTRRARDGSPLWRSMVQLALSSAHFQLGEWEDANVHADFVYSRATTQSDPFMQSAARLNQAAIAIARQEWQTALNALEECILLQLTRPQAGILAGGLTGLAHIAIEQSLPELASRLLRSSHSISSDRRPLASVRHSDRRRSRASISPGSVRQLGFVRCWPLWHERAFGGGAGRSFNLDESRSAGCSFDVYKPHRDSAPEKGGRRAHTPGNRGALSGRGGQDRSGNCRITFRANERSRAT